MAHRVAHPLRSRQMTDDQHNVEPTQQTRPKKGEPIEIPVPKERDVLGFLEKVARTPDPDATERGAGDAGVGAGDQ